MVNVKQRKEKKKKNTGNGLKISKTKQCFENVYIYTIYIFRGLSVKALATNLRKYQK